MIDSPEGAERIELILAFNRFADKADALIRGGSTHQTVTLSGGSFGLWAAVTCCIVMLAAMAVAVPVGVGAYLAMQGDLKEVREELKTAQAFISAVYVAAPQLKPKDDEKKEE
jgi:ABC-type phosphate transport system permease subunit